jgi:hypothetical protein
MEKLDLKKLRLVVDEFFAHEGEKVNADSCRWGEALYYHAYAAKFAPNTGRALLERITELEEENANLKRLMEENRVNHEELLTARLASDQLREQNDALWKATQERVETLTRKEKCHDHQVMYPLAIHRGYCTDCGWNRTWSDKPEKK